MSWITTKYQKRRKNDDTIVLTVKVCNYARNEECEIEVDPDSTEEQVLDALAIKIKQNREVSDTVEAMLDTNTLEAKINTLP
jgi:hypothetical protein